MRAVNAISLFCRTIYCPEKWRIALPSAMSTSAVYQNKNSNIASTRNKKNEFLKEFKEGYEDTFGNIEYYERTFEKIADDPEDILEYQRAKAAKGKKVLHYIKEIKSFLNNNDYKSALKVLEIDMVNDRKPRITFVYKILINYNAYLGNLKEAYRLFINFKKRQGIVTGAMYTSMFNACANCKDVFLALEKANAVRECMNSNKFHSANISNYNAMLKAYGRHGDFHTCLKIMDEVMEKKDKVRSDTYLFLLQACISDRNSGLRHGLLVWRKMLQNRIKPSIFSFNLMLRCIRDCSLGDVFLVPDLIKQIQEESTVFFRRKVKTETIGNEKRRTVLKIPVENKLLESQEEPKQYFAESKEPNYLQLEEVKSFESLNLKGSEVVKHENILEPNKNEGDSSNNTVDSISTSVSILDNKEELKNITEVIFSSKSSELPNLLALKPRTGSVLEFGVCVSPHYRLMLVGGVKGFLETMRAFEVKPDLKTFTLMLSVIPSTLQAEEELMSLMKAYDIHPDVGFFNVLIKRRILRREDTSLKVCLEQMHALNLKPDILTFGILAMACTTYELGMELLNTLHNHSFRANSEILHPLLRNAKCARDLKYVRAILRVAKEDEVELRPNFVALLAEIVKNEQHLRQSNKESAEKITENDKSKLDNEIASSCEI